MIENLHLVTQPIDLKISLFPHQLSSIYKMEKLESEKCIETSSCINEIDIGINADIQGYGKCWSFNTDILLYNGNIEKVQYIKIGDILMGDDSKKRKVLSVSTGREQMYIIKQKKGVDYKVNESHILSLYVIKTKIIYFLDNISIVKYFDTNKLKFKYKIFKCCNFINKSKTFYNNLNINPKVDISLKKYISLPNNIKKILNGYKSIVDFKNKNLKDLKNIEDISHDYIVNTIKNREKILTKIFQLSTNQEHLEYRSKYTTDCVNFLLLSLGYFTELIEDNGVYKIYYKKNIIYNNIVYYDIEVIKDEIGEYYGFTIDGNNRLLLGDFTVNHNTMSMIGLIVRDRMEWDLENPFVIENTENRYNGHSKIRTIRRYNKLPSTLILVNNSILNQWKEELKNSSLNVYIISNKKSVLDFKPLEYDVVLVTQTMYNSLLRFYGDKAWKRFIFDEPGHIKIASMYKIIAGFYWFVTATPSSIIDKHKGCKNGFMRGIFGDDWQEFKSNFEHAILKNNDDIVRRSFQMPPTNHYYYNCFQSVYDAIKGLTSSIIIDLISAGDIEGAINALGGNKTSNIVDLIKNKKLKELEEINCKIQIYTLREDNIKIQECINKQTIIISHINELEKRFEIMLSGNCNICFDKIQYPVMEPNCHNIFCTKCLLQWLSNKQNCPLCRININDITKLIYIQNNNIIGEKQNTVENILPTKLQKVIELINSSDSGKFIIFSSHDGTFFPICSILRENNISFTCVKGKHETREKNILNFKEGLIKVLCLNSEYNGSGINLQEASDIILYHEMIPTTQTQILGRANRIGRQIPLKVHHLKYK
jgi:hypothetical protein